MPGRGGSMRSDEPLRLPTREDVLEAAARLAGIAHRTPVVTSSTLDERIGGRVFIKCESLQRGGAFKFRGAYNAISRLDRATRRAGVLAFSSGNHAQAVAITGRMLGVATTIVMPESAPRAKLEATRGYGAEVITYDPAGESREELAHRIAAERGLTVIPPYDHPDIVAGQGTAALELLEDAGPLDLLLVPCGGGGLLGGSALAASGSGCRVVGVEPELADDATRSFRTGELQTVRNPPTIADGLRTPSLGAVTWPLVRAHVDDMATVTEAEIASAMEFCWSRLKLVIEPSGAVPLALLLRGFDHGAGRIGILVSGGNVDPEVACSLITRPPEPIVR
jgi:threonine dehydratase